MRIGLCVKHYQRILDLLRAALPQALAVYAFGSQLAGTAQAGSDLDLAVLVILRPGEALVVSDVAKHRSR
jgi:predicted nucleotidyltransferase